MSQEPDNQVMWVRYAAGHTGFALGFNVADRFFKECKRDLRKVVYEIPQENAPGVDPFPDVCFYKHPDWHDEIEWRCVQGFERDESRDVFFDPSIISEVIFGHLADSNLKRQILKYLWDYGIFPGVPIKGSAPDRANRCFTNTPEQYEVCKHCEGEGFRNLLRFVEAR
jgi:hypothetical protein